MALSTTQGKEIKGMQLPNQWVYCSDTEKLTFNGLECGMHGQIELRLIW